MSKIISILGYYGHGNTGDESILEGLKTSIEKIDPSIDIYVISDHPELVMKDHNINSIKKIQSMYENISSPVTFLKNLISNMNLMGQSKVLIIGGGGLYHDYFKSIPYGLNEIIIAKLKGKPIILFSVGVGPYKTKLGKIFAKMILNQTDLITVRDEGSKMWLEEIGVKTPKTIVSVDPVLLLPTSPDNVLIDIGQKKCSWFGISVRPWFDDEDFKDKMARISDYIIEEYDAEVIFIPMHPGRDDKISYEIINRIHFKHKARVVNGNISFIDRMYIINKMDVLIAMRLHAIIFASKMNVPIVGIIYDPKVDSFLEKIQQKEYASYIDKMDVDDLKAKINAVWKNRENIKQIIKENMLVLEDIAEKNLIYMQQFLR